MKNKLSESIKNMQAHLSELDKILKEHESELTALRESKNDKIVDPSSESYYYIRSDEENNFKIASGNISVKRPDKYAFKYLKDAEFIKEKMLLMQEMFYFAAINNTKVPDWNNRDELKFGIKIGSSGYGIDYFKDTNVFAFGVTFNTKEIAEKALGIFGERIKLYYNKQY